MEDQRIPLARFDWRVARCCRLSTGSERSRLATRSLREPRTVPSWGIEGAIEV